MAVKSFVNVKVKNTLIVITKTTRFIFSINLYKILIYMLD